MVAVTELANDVGTSAACQALCMPRASYYRERRKASSPAATASRPSLSQSYSDPRPKWAHLLDAVTLVILPCRPRARTLVGMTPLIAILLSPALQSGK